MRIMLTNIPSDVQKWLKIGNRTEVTIDFLNERLEWVDHQGVPASVDIFEMLDLGICYCFVQVL